MVEGFIEARIVLMIISTILIIIVTKKRIQKTVSNQIFLIITIFWTSIFIIALNPNILDNVLQITGLENRSQFLLIISIIIILYLLYHQISKNKLLTLKFHNIISEIAISNYNQKISISKNSIVILIPAFNEVKSLGIVLDSIPDSILNHPISKVVIDDGSSDDTHKVAIDSKAYCLRHESNLGQGSALITGINFALPFTPKVIVTFDADGQHDINDLEKIVKLILENKCDMSVGSRFIGNQEYSNTERLIGIHFFTKLINFLCKSNISDSTNGLRAIKPEIFNKIKLREKKFSAPEILVETIMKGYKIENVPTTIKKRTAGTTKKPRLGFAFGLFRVIMGTWLHNKI